MTTGTLGNIEVINNEHDLLKWKHQWVDAFKSGSPTDLSASFHSLGNDFLYLTENHEHRYLYLLHQNDRLKAIISIKEIKTKLLNRFPIKKLLIGGHYINDMFIAEDTSHSELTALLRRIIHDFPAIGWIDINQVTEQHFKRISPWFENAPFYAYTTNAGSQYCFKVKIGSFEIFKKNLGKKTRSNMAYYQRLLEREHGTVTFEFTIPEMESENTKLLDEFLKLEHSGWKGAQNSSILDKPSSYDYHKGMSNSAQKQRQMLWARCIVNEKLVAMMYVISRGDQLWALKTAYDENYHRYSPGALLAFKLIEYGFERPEIEKISMITSYDWVKRWKPETEEYHALKIFPKTIKASILRYLLLQKNPDWHKV
jgi:hypothetical protein